MKIFLFLQARKKIQRNEQELLNKKVEEEGGKSVPKLDVQLVNLLLINLEKVMHKLQLKVEKGDEEKEKLEFMDFDSLEMKIVILDRLRYARETNRERRVRNA